MADAFWGEIRAFTFTFAPQGWAYCWGSQMLIQQQSTLYAVLGITYGGDGKSTFNLPDLRGRAPMNSGTGVAGNGSMSAAAGQVTGVPTVALTVTQTATHNHEAMGVQALAHQTLTGTPSATAYVAIPRNTATITNYDAWSAAAPTTTLAPQTLGTACGNAQHVADPHSNISPYLAMNFCICIEGAVFPMRQ